mmetsp:Transcript_33471/g.58337  ORF Transcript_33471/g.58337 Transcript_33471/m.58337 type:complete len:283 (+) Transcript_33471:2-850(+)
MIRALQRVQIPPLFLQRHTTFADTTVAGRGGWDVAFEHDLRRRRSLQRLVTANPRVDQFGTGTPQQTGKLILGQAVRHRRDRAEDGGGVGAEGDCHRERLAGMSQRMVAEVQRSAPVRQPAHDDLARTDQLLPVDAQVLARPCRAPRDDQPPRDQGGGVVGPAMLDREAPEVDVACPEHLLLAGGMALNGGLHVPQRLHHLQQLAGVFQTLGRLRLLEAGQHPSDIPQIGQRVRAHAERDATGGPEQIGQGRRVVAGRRLEQQGRSTRPQNLVAQGRHFEHR